MDYTDTIPSPEIWRRWGAISILAAILERKVWVRTGLGPLYPNMYVVLCGPPGTGKTAITSLVHKFLIQLADGTDKGFQLGSSSVNFASLIDELILAKRDIVRLDLDPNRYEFNSLTIISNELGVLLPEYDQFMMPKLTDLWDCHPYSERRRGRKEQDRVDRPQLNLLAACTPSYLTSTLPQGAWDQGFLSRTMIVFSTETPSRELFSELTMTQTLSDALIHDLKFIFNPDNTFGGMKFDESARDAIEKWHRAGGKPQPEHPKLMHYLTRRTAHLIKLCVVASIARGNDLIITREDFDEALGWLLEMEIYLGDIFKSMGQGGDNQVIQECWYHFAREYTQAGGKSIPEPKVIAFLSQRLPAHSVVRVLDIMIRAGMLKEEINTGFGKGYKPLPIKSP